MFGKKKCKLFTQVKPQPKQNYCLHYLPKYYHTIYGKARVVPIQYVSAMIMAEPPAGTIEKRALHFGGVRKLWPGCE